MKTFLVEVLKFRGMESKLKTFLVGFTAFIVSTVIVSLLRYYLTFRQLCQTQEEMMGMQQGLGIMSCPSIPEVFLVTLVSPLFFMLALSAAVLAGYGYNRLEG